jgi:ribosomal protein S18 acetylase RimI-like enzyme
MKLRRAEMADVAKLALVGAASFLETFANDHPGDSLVAFTRETHSDSGWQGVLANERNAVWIVEEAAGSPIGYAVLAPASLPGTSIDDAELKRIYVLSKWHGSGMGRALFDAAETEARARHAARLVLSVYTRNVRAIGFYERQGFATIGRAMFPGFGEEFSDFVMAKLL